MNFTTRNLLISIFCALLVGLIASAATPVVFAEESNVAEEEPYWGNLKAGDEMRWHWYPGFAGSFTDIYYELEILAIYEKSLKVDYNNSATGGAYGETYTHKRGTATWTSDELWPWIYPASLLQANQDVKKTIYTYNGRTYTAAYLEWYDESDSHHEYWWDYSTGILFSRSLSPCGYGCSYPHRLEYTNAHLTSSMITDISGPDEVVTGQPFTITVTIKNQEYKDVENVTATIDLPNGFSLTSGSMKKSIGTITAGENKTVSWTAKAAEPGDFSITVSINSANRGSDSVTITLHVNPGVAYILTQTTYAGLPPFMWIVLICAGSGIVLLVVLKKRGKVVLINLTRYHKSLAQWFARWHRTRAERPSEIRFICLFQFIVAAGIGALGVTYILFARSLETTAFSILFIPLLPFLPFFVMYTMLSGNVPDSLFPALGIVAGAVYVILGVLGFIATYGLWNLKRWALWATLSLQLFLSAEVVLSIGVLDIVTMLIIIPVTIVLYPVIAYGVWNFKRWALWSTLSLHIPLVTVVILIGVIFESIGRLRVITPLSAIFWSVTMLLIIPIIIVKSLVILYGIWDLKRWTFWVTLSLQLLLSTVLVAMFFEIIISYILISALFYLPLFIGVSISVSIVRYLILLEKHFER